MPCSIESHGERDRDYGLAARSPAGRRGSCGIFDVQRRGRHGDRRRRAHSDGKRAGSLVDHEGGLGVRVTGGVDGEGALRLQPTQGYIGLVGRRAAPTERLEERLWDVTQAVGYKNPVQAPAFVADSGNDEDEDLA
jgi:hypothetical protein